MTLWTTLGLGLTVVGPLVLFLLRRPIGRAVGAASRRVAGSLGSSRIIWRGGDGVGTGLCPRCKSPVTYGRVAAGESAFSCANCGESGTWT